MTHTEKLAFIHAKCIEANPEIVALVRGCEIQVKPEHRRDMGIKLGYVAGVDFAVMAETESSLTHADMSLELVRAYPEKFEIIGRPIRLADVLFTTARKFIAYKDEMILRVVEGWNPLKDDLNEQGEATIDFIHSILL